MAELDKYPPAQPQLLIGRAPPGTEHSWPGHELVVGEAIVGVHSVRQRCIITSIVMVLMSPRADDLAHVHKHLGDLVGMFCGRLVVLLTPGGTYPAVGIADVLGRYLVDELARAPGILSVAGPLPQDRRGADVLRGERRPGRRWPRLPLPAALQRIMGELAPQLGAASRNGVGS